MIIFDSLLSLLLFGIVNLVFVISPALCSDDIIESESSDRFKIEGKVTMTDGRKSEWIGVARVLVDGGDYVGYLRFWAFYLFINNHKKGHCIKCLIYTQGSKLNFFDHRLILAYKIHRLKWKSTS